MALLWGRKRCCNGEQAEKRQAGMEANAHFSRTKENAHMNDLARLRVVWRLDSASRQRVNMGPSGCFGNSGNNCGSQGAKPLKLQDWLGDLDSDAFEIAPSTMLWRECVAGPVTADRHHH
jgi:hypothetical protein